MHIQYTVTINAPVQRVWQIFTDLTCWKDWSTVMRDVSSESGDLEKGSNFRFCIRPFALPMRLKPTVEELDPFKRIVWAASARGTRTRHEFTFIPVNRKTIVASIETFKSPWLLFSFIRLPREKLQALTELMLHELKEAAERNGSLHA